MPHQQGRIRQCSDPHRDIETVLDQVEVAIVQDELHLRVGELVEEGDDERRDVTTTKLQRGGDPDETAYGTVRDSRNRGVVCTEQRSRVLREHPSGLGRGQPARGPLHEAGANSILKGR